ncbi:MAG: sigma-54 interaction domain-containing protein [Planctomycetaceae bacterium]
MPTAVQSQEWMSWRQLPWLSAPEGGETIPLCERLLQAGVVAESVDGFFQAALPEVATGFSVQWAGVVHRTPQWRVLAECGRAPEIPYHRVEESLDRESAGYWTLDEPAGWGLIAVPLESPGVPGAVLVLAGRNLDSGGLRFALAAGRAIGIGLTSAAKREGMSRRIERLRTTLEIASSIASVRESQPLLELIAEEATRLLECDRASIFIWDREHHEMVACPALGVEDNTLRIPDDAGIVGDVLHSGKAARVDDAYDDPRFDRSVDKKSGYVTHNLLCQPMRDGDGELIGAFEVINKIRGAFTADDDESLTQLGRQAAIAILNTREREELIRSREQLTEQVTQGVQIIGDSPAIAGLRATIERLAATDLPVLILGASGTGKEVVAQSLHYHGPRAKHPFVTVNCAAIAETLLESELFGHEKGAFTDAHESRAGKFELAEGGTIFLDEIGDMSPGGQANLLRVLEQKVVTRVGGSQTIPINVRVIAATNANLTEKVRDKTFREDLYYRLSVVTQQIPPLCERAEDIIPLAEHFLKQFCAQARRKTQRISAEARRRLQAHSWPGNVRELRNLMERVAFLSQGDKVEADDLAFILSPDRDDALQPSADFGLTEATQRFQKDFIRRSIKRVRGNMSEAAKLLGLHRSNLYRKMRQLEMSEGDGE